MLCLLQRVTHASVTVEGEIIARIDDGLLVLVGVERGDTSEQVVRMAERLLAYRVFADDAGKMNLSVVQSGGGVLLVPQFTLAAITSKGNRPSFGSAADPELAQTLCNELLQQVGDKHSPVGAGMFGADMKVALTNDGPVTFMLRVNPAEL